MTTEIKIPAQDEITISVEGDYLLISSGFSRCARIALMNVSSFIDAVSRVSALPLTPHVPEDRTPPGAREEVDPNVLLAHEEDGDAE